MIPDKMREVLKKDGVVAIATLGQDGPHLVNTWNSYVRITDDERLLIPAGFMHRTEANIATNNNVLITMGSSKVAGKKGPGTGFLIKGTAAFLTSGAVLGITMNAGIPRRRAAREIACAWLPEECVATPRAASSSAREKTALHAPRILKAPTFCRFSPFKNTCASTLLSRFVLVNTGV